MRRWLLYGIAFTAALLLDLSPFRGTDVGKLLPVETVRICRENGEIRLQTDTGDTGKGTDINEALLDLKATTAGNVFLETADYLLVKPGCEEMLGELADILRPSCGVCVEVGEAELEKVAKFFAAHEPQVTLQKWRSGNAHLPMLMVKEGRMELVT